MEGMSKTFKKSSMPKLRSLRVAEKSWKRHRRYVAGAYYKERQDWERVNDRNGVRGELRLAIEAALVQRIAWRVKNIPVGRQGSPAALSLNPDSILRVIRGEAVNAEELRLQMNWISWGLHPWVKKLGGVHPSAILQNNLLRMSQMKRREGHWLKTSATAITTLSPSKWSTWDPFSMVARTTCCNRRTPRGGQSPSKPSDFSAVASPRYARWLITERILSIILRWATSSSSAVSLDRFGSGRGDATVYIW